MQFNLFGRSVKMTAEKIKPIPDIVKQAQDLLMEYQNLMKPFQDRWIENEEWYKLRHWELMRNSKFSGEPEPTTAMLFSAIEQKHADAMDFYPKPNILPRESDDLSESRRLSEIIPVELEWNDYLDTWSGSWYDKLKLGSSIQGVLFDKDGAGGIGANTIKKINHLRFFCDPSVEHLKDSKGVFIMELIDEDAFKETYPEADFSKVGKFVEPRFYNSEINKKDTSKLVVAFDFYYLKRNSASDIVCHMLKFAGSEKLYWSEEDPEYSEGFYQIEQYPFEIDVMYQEKDSIFGFGLIDVTKSPQVYIDKLDQIILANTFKHSRKRFFVSDDSTINMEDYADPSKDFVRVAGLINEEHIKEIDVKPTDSGVHVHRTNKINELKEISSTNDSSRGEAGGGVTAAQAIALLQKASGKTTRAMLTQSYSVFSKLMYIYIELIRQFYDIPRTIRIPDKKSEDGFRFEPFTNEGILPKPTGITTEGEDGMAVPKMRKPVFDIKVVPEKQDPFSQEAHNERVLGMYKDGLFNPQRSLEAEIVLEHMDIEGKEKMLQKVRENSEIFKALQMLQQENMKLKMIAQATTGKDLGVPMPKEGATI